MTQTVKKSIHAQPVPVEEALEDTIPSVPDNVSTALVPVVEETTIEIAEPRTNFAVAKARRMMKESYTGKVPIHLEDMDKRAGVTYLIVKGAYIQVVDEHINEETGELVKGFTQYLLKLEDDRIISCGGVMASKWVKDLIADLGELDWPESINVAVSMKQGKRYPYPLFQTID